MGKAIAISRLERSAAELRDQAVKTEDGAVVRRLLGIALVLEGHSRQVAVGARQYVVSHVITVSGCDSSCCRQSA